MTVTPAGTEVSYVVTYLEMTGRPTFDWPTLPPGPPASLMRAEEPPLWYFRSLYEAVGRDYVWEDVTSQTDEELAPWFSRDGMILYTLTSSGWPHGFFLLDETEAEVTDLAYFGLVPEAVGRRFGGWMLKTAILTAWERAGVKRMTVNTCTLDHPRALPLYQKHGFTPVRQEQKSRILMRDAVLTD